ncbi:hypothetical protein [Yersinia phage fHe-Yen9-04]|uniref:Uncharacterized protein n=2 Tax=Eneladusvirus Yen904 TaxID=2560849 RepID=A0A2C9CXY5_9CAUD|nr:hypothetical protein FDJ41_gp391 [Yersinia phage fHe-Yen9-04]SOK58789.1 hypothetical protein [Yersinia phage fHe-Yen9-04]SOK59327.1 hypothetical protein [Yersinia phage fHe-Yen9-03]VUE36558.1 hypothetical protein [Yersinia phage fHe-Yen9-04]
MDLISSVLIFVSLIGLILFMYANLSSFIQISFNKNFDIDKHEDKWQMKTSPFYVILIIGFINLVNFFVQSPTLKFITDVAFIAGSLAYTVALCVNFYKMYKIS